MKQRSRSIKKYTAQLPNACAAMMRFVIREIQMAAHIPSGVTIFQYVAVIYFRRKMEGNVLILQRERERKICDFHNK